MTYEELFGVAGADPVEAFIERGHDLFADHPEQALEYFQRALDVLPNDAALHNDLGITYWTLQQADKAIEHVTLAARYAPDELQYVLNAGAILTAAGKFGQAESIYKRYLRTFPGTDEVLMAQLETQRLREEAFRPRPEPPAPVPLGLPTRFLSHKRAAIDSFLDFLSGRELPKYPLDIFLEVSNVCDLKCVMCATFSSINPKRHHNIAGTERGFLDHAVLAPMEELLQHALKVHCFGYGEPTINPNFRSFIEYLGQFEVLVDFFSNGMHLTDDLVGFLVEHHVGDITVSFSGSTKEEYEQVYQGGVFEQVLGGLARLRDRKRETGRQFPRVAINSLAYRHHLSTFDRFVEMMADHGAGVIYLKPLLECGDHLPALVGHSALITPELRETVIARAKRIAQERDVILSIAPELYVETPEEEHARHIDFSGLTKEQYEQPRTTLPVSQFKALAGRTQQAKVEQRHHWNVRPVDIQHGTEEEIDRMLEVGPSSYAHGDDYHFYCLEPFKTMYVLENGQTKPCCNVPGDTPAIGNVIENGGGAVWNGKGFGAYRRAIMNDQYPLKGCGTCLKYKTGPKTHFADQMIAEYRRWHSALFAETLPEGLSGAIAQLGDGQAVIGRFAAVRTPGPTAEHR